MNFVANDLQGQHLDHIFEVNLIQRESKRVNLIKSLSVLVTPKSSLAFSDAIQEVQVPENESIPTFKKERDLRLI